MRILAAEDNPVNQLVLKALLAQIGVDPTIVENGLEAVRAWEDAEWDVILMDVQMPQMDGPTATRLIRAREAELGRPPTPIIAVTANAMIHQMASYRAAGMTEVVSKPINVEALFSAIIAAVTAPEPQSQRRAPADPGRPRPVCGPGPHAGTACPGSQRGCPCAGRAQRPRRYGPR